MRIDKPELSNQQVQRKAAPRTQGGALIRNRLKGHALTRLDGLVVRARSRWRRWVAAAIILAPSFVAAFYFLFVAADRYVSEAAFVVRTAAKPQLPDGIGSMLSMAGLSRSTDDAFAVHAFMLSRDAVGQLEKTLPLREMFGRENADFVARYPSFLFAPTNEDLYAYYKHVVKVSYSATTGISRLKVDLFDPKDAEALAATLLDLSEALVNDLNRKIQDDAVGFAEQDVANAQDRLIHSQALLTAYRNRELIIDPDADARALVELTGKLSAQLAAIKARIAELETSAPDSPLLPGLRSRAQALQSQLDAASQGVASSGDKAGLAQKMSEYEALEISHQFANEDLGRALASLEMARSEARKQQLFLERVVQPSLPDASSAPDRVQLIASIFAGNLILFLVGWFVWTGVREHAASAA